MWQIAISIVCGGLIFLFFYLAVHLNTEDPKYNYLKVLFLWLGFTFIIPSLYIMRIIASNKNASVGRLLNLCFISYFPIYALIVWLIIILYIKDFLNDLRKSADEVEPHERL